MMLLHSRRALWCSETRRGTLIWAKRVQVTGGRVHSEEPLPLLDLRGPARRRLSLMRDLDAAASSKTYKD